ncbi:capsid protein [Oceanobacillus kimchii]|uniref:phage tail tube protein n=1 Tax=Oceanobacillus kimchii TaxID=746691 RepID=UPI0021A4D20A|nr:capsid protein [Oceanobacillus kimchii]MCT1577949.1 capsid protein [Oceanobacillus kimchii]MCT2137509.1 capsid protein [Oceanobacillus kimchii]
MEQEMHLMNAHLFEIKTGTDIYARVGAGINSAEPANNEETDQTKYMIDGGFASTDVIGAQVTLAFSGHRDYADAAQNYIFGKVLELGPTRRTEFRWTEPDGTILEGACTIANISGPSGEAGAKGEISFEIHFNGKPKITREGENDGGTDGGSEQ